MKIRDFSDFLQSLRSVVFGMERTGVCIDTDVLADIELRATADARDTRDYLDNVVREVRDNQKADTNWNYAAWLAGFIYGSDGLGLPPSEYCDKGKVRDGKLSTDGTALEWLAATNPEHRDTLNAIIKLRRQARVANYASTWLGLAVKHPDGSYRLHPCYGMGNDADTRPGARTGRFGIKNPALAQVPADQQKDTYGLRRAFIAPPGKVLVAADYSQLELVIMAHVCVRLFGATGLRDRLMPGAPDLHSATAKYVFGDTLGIPEMLAADVGKIKGHPQLGIFRQLVKAIRYGLAYGKGDYTFGHTLFEMDAEGNITGPPIGQQRAKQFVDAVLGMDPELPQYQEWVWTYGKKTRMFPSLMGRWDVGPEIRLTDEYGRPDWQAKRKYRQWLNWCMQGGGQEIVGKVMCALAEAGIEQSLQIHDELHVYSDEDKVDETIARMRDIGENTVRLQAPLSFSPKKGSNWYECK